MTLALNSLANAAYRLRQSRAANLVFIVALVGCIGLIALARVENADDGMVYSLTGRSSIVSLVSRYVSAEGTLLTEQAYQTEANVGGLQLTGGRYVPLMIEGAQDPVFVYDKAIPAPGADGLVRLTGRMVAGTGAQPPVYIEVGRPPNVTLQNLLARLGLVLAALLLLGWLAVWLISRKDYALGASGDQSGAATSIGALWFGSLGAEYGNAVVRQEPVVVSKTPGELKLESAASRPPWAVHIRQVKRAQPASIATAHGALPGARIEFEDERGLTRHGTVVVGGEAGARTQLAGLLQGAGAK
jgi:hypothetical protein